MTGIPGMPEKDFWMTLPLCLLYSTTFLGNVIILVVIKIEQTATDLSLSLSPMPTMISVHWFNWRSITLDACITQMFFIHTFGAVESGVLVVMAFDCFVAIRFPLHLYYLSQLPLCHSNILSHAYCLHQDVIRLACADTRGNCIYGLLAVIFIIVLDALILSISYFLILQAVLGIASQEQRLRALNTCFSHICAVLFFYVPLIGTTLIHCFGKHLSPIVHTLMANVYLLLPPVLNPIVYSVRTKQIWQQIVRVVCSQFTMVIFNNTTSSSPNFLLTAFPGLELAHVWISIPVCCLYIIALLGNSMILFVIVIERSLHKPMYYFLSMLSTVDLCLTISTLPTVLGVLWFHAREISLKACLIQMFFVHGFSFLESSVLVAMAFDRFMAICNPLKYATVFTDMIILVIGLVICLRQVIFTFPMVLVLKS
ncbi:hypothetical protein GH733_001504, partial [Mirounga leonina]